MSGRMSKYDRQFSPERRKVWTERPPKYAQNRRVPVIYYLCRNRQLEHPHFMEVPLSSPEGLYLRDVIERLNDLRGKGMASMYSWSCKRSYKNGFVWHDLCEDDLIVPAHVNEYVLKGSEVVGDSNSGGFSRTQNVKQLTESQAPLSTRSQEDTSTSISMIEKDTEHQHQQEDEISPPSRSSGSSAVSPESRIGNDDSSSTWPSSKREGAAAADASTQTEVNCTKRPPSNKLTRETCVSTEDGKHGGTLRSHTHHSKKKLDSWTCQNLVSSSPSSLYMSSSKREQAAETMETLIRSDVNNKRKILGEGSSSTSMATSQHDVKMKASNLLMQLISCGSLTVKDANSYGLVPAYKPQLSQLKFPSPLYSTSMMLGELDCLWENPRLTAGLKSEDKEYFSGSLLETKLHKEEEHRRESLKRSSSYNAERTSSSKQLESSTVIKNEEEEDERTKSPSRSSKCLPRSIKSSLLSKQQPRSESMRSSITISEKPRKSSARASDSSIFTSRDASSNASSNRTTEPSPTNHQSQRLDSFRHGSEDKVIQTEES